jgi:hypothetical protein
MNPMLMQMLQQYYAQMQGGRGMGGPQGMGMGQPRTLGAMAGYGGGMGMGGGYGGPRPVAPQENTIQGSLAPQSPWSQQMNQIIGAGAGGPLPPPDMTDNSVATAAARAAGFGGGGMQSGGYYRQAPAPMSPQGQQMAGMLRGTNAVQGPIDLQQTTSYASPGQLASMQGMPRMAQGPGLMRQAEMARGRRGYY